MLNILFYIVNLPKIANSLIPKVGYVKFISHVRCQWVQTEEVLIQRNAPGTYKQDLQNPGSKLDT